MSLFCPICGKQEAQHKTITETFEYKGHKITIDDYDVIHCYNCGETLVRQESMERYKSMLRDFKNEIDSFHEKLNANLVTMGRGGKTQTISRIIKECQEYLDEKH